MPFDLLFVVGNFTYTATATCRATSGGNYTWDGSQYIYLWGTAKTDAGYHWRIGVTLDDEETYYVIVDLR